MNVTTVVLIAAIIVRIIISKDRNIVRPDASGFLIAAVVVAISFVTRSLGNIISYFYMIVGHVPKEISEYAGLAYWMVPAFTWIVILSVSTVQGFSNVFHQGSLCLIMCYYMVVLLCDRFPAYNWLFYDAEFWKYCWSQVTVIMSVAQVFVLICLLMRSKYTPKIPKRFRSKCSLRLRMQEDC